MIGSMRHRGPTTTSELSPGLYMDKHCTETPPMLVGDSTKSDVHPANGLYNSTSAVSTSKASRIPSATAAALSRMHSSSTTNNCFSHPNRVQRQDFKSKYPSQTTGLMNTAQEKTTTTSNKSGRYMNQRKLRKKGSSSGSSKRETRFQMNGSTDQNLHSLKVTIRRTYNSSELENGVCAIVNTPEENTTTANNNIGSNNHESLHRSYNPMNSIQTEHCDSQHLNGKLNTKDLYSLRGLSTLKDSRVYVDSSTSTVDSATLTEPNLLGPCEPGTKIIVEGVVWMEATGMLVLSLHWRGRNYMGTLLDSSKQTFAPTCMDKGVASALNLLRGRKAWCDTSQRGYQARGIHHFHHMRHHRRGGGGSGAGAGAGGAGHGVGGSMTTRSASAAAAAASQDSTETDIDSKEQQQPTNPDPYSTDCIDQPYMVPETTFNNHNNLGNKRTLPPSDIPQRGAKGRRRRGGAGTAGRRPIMHHSVNSALSLSDENLSTSSEVKSSAPTDDNVVVHNSETPPPITDSTTGDSDSTTSSHLPLNCPFIDCKKRFSDILSMRYHFTLGHSKEQTNNTESSVQGGGLSTVYPSQRKQLSSMKTEKNTVVIDNHHDDGVDGVHDYAEDDDVEISICDISASSSSPPPKLARAHVIKDRSSSDSNDTSLLLINGDENDDNIEPPKLHRVISIPDSFTGVGVHPTGIGDSTTSKFDTIINNNIIITATNNHNNNNVLDIPDDEPPAASPAYSDISDDGTISSTTTNIPILNVARATVDVHSSRESLLSNSPSILSSNLSNQPSLSSQGYIDVSRRLNLSPLILSACSPTLLGAGTGDSSKLYLPANIFPSNLKGGVNSIFYQNPPATVKCVDKQNIENGCLKSSIGNTSTINFNDVSSPQSSSAINGASLPPAPPLIPPQALSNHQHYPNSSRPLTFLSVSPGLINEQNTRPSSTGPLISNPPYTFCVSRNSPIPPLPGVSDQRILSPHNTNHNHHSSTSHRQPPTMS
ncbi:unnamed protein product [Trichobilharzia szidati]|nr:unnamed protein product [Trichobilharzia szidati]